MNELQIFNFNGSYLREITDQNGEPWFMAKDICSILGTETRDISKILDEDEVDSIHIERKSGKPNVIVSESGLYALALRSRKPEAKTFRKWITSEVLPQIRKTGSYGNSNGKLSDRDISMISAVAAEVAMKILGKFENHEQYKNSVDDIPSPTTYEPNEDIKNKVAVKFLKEFLPLRQEYIVLRTELYSRYVAWCELTSSEYLGKKNFYILVRSKGAKDIKQNGMNYFRIFKAQ